MANYTIDRSRSAAGSITVTEATIDTSTNVTLVGQNYTGYGDEIATNFLQMLENYAADVAPESNPRVPGASAITGQLWYDTANGVLNVYDGTGWQEQSKTNTGTVESSSIRWNNTNNRWQEEERVRISDAGSLIVANSSAGTNAVTFNHGGTNFTATFAGTTDFTLSGLSGDLTVTGGRGLSVENGATALAIRAGGSSDINFTAASADTLNMPAGVKMVTAAATVARAGINIPPMIGTPGSPANGDIWVDGGSLYVRLAGSTIDVAAAAGGTVTSTGSPADNQVAVWTAVADQLEGTAGLTYNGTTLTVSGNVSATQIGGITQANLVDKNATEVIGGAWSFTNATPITVTAGDVNVQNGNGFVSTDGAYAIGIRADSATTDIQFTHSNTPDWNISGLGQIYVDGASLWIDNVTGEALRLESGFSYDSASMNSVINFRGAGSVGASITAGARSTLEIRGQAWSGSYDSVRLYGNNSILLLRTTSNLIGRHSGNDSAFITQDPGVAGNTTSLKIYDDRDVTTGAGGYDVGYNGTPQPAVINGTYTVTYEDIGKYLRCASGTPVIQLPADANIPVGAQFLVHNDHTASISITQTSGTAIEWIDGSGTDKTSNTYTVAVNSIVSVRKKDGTRWQIWGNGIS